MYCFCFLYKISRGVGVLLNSYNCTDISRLSLVLGDVRLEAELKGCSRNPDLIFIHPEKWLFNHGATP